MNLEIAAKIKEELRTALNTKELESFARQIACGMVSDAPPPNSDPLFSFPVMFYACYILDDFSEFGIEGILKAFRFQYITICENYISYKEHIANLDIIHRDLAARNILLGENKVLKISDFGLSREGMYVKQTVGKIPFRWLSIEAIVERTYTTASDV